MIFEDKIKMETDSILFLVHVLLYVIVVFSCIVEICQTLGNISHGKNIETKLNQTEDNSLKDLLNVGEWKITKYVCDPGYFLIGPQMQICNSKLDHGRWLIKGKHFSS